MAAPAGKTITDLNGKWQLNKTLSDSSEPILALQGIGYLTRKGINIATITLDINQYTAPPKPPNTSTDLFTHVDIVQSASGLTSTKENRCLDETFREHSDWLFGNVKGSSKFVTLDEIDDDFLKQGWLPDQPKFIRSYVESQGNGWIATQIWGFEEINGERRYVRHVLVTKGSERVTAKLVYDYQQE
ncbi:Hypothetical protein NCS54_00062500 [Fusarium falciforme]|uniref:Lccl domain-containing protein n=1 Tax=Fusarium falciforme TaxID=195108 RepID=A0A9W8V7D9_9HYPO|nr:Hypothetical protein NCS54_00062500 [Fusarium falciforme]KAJ4196530.1 hypothetical protein NW755_001315 [Fusarium falciforme]WAO83436.1 Hypothetical protein NCS54_00062500 [Fusarium falciforme]